MPFTRAKPFQNLHQVVVDETAVSKTIKNIIN
jgi:hypothetical protein